MAEFEKYSSNIIEVANKVTLLNTPDELTSEQAVNVTSQLNTLGWEKGLTHDDNATTGYVGQAYVNESQKLIIIDSRCAEAISELKNALSSIVNSVNLENISTNDLYALAHAVYNAPNTAPDLKSAVGSIIIGQPSTQIDSARSFIGNLIDRYPDYKFITTGYCNGAPAAYDLAMNDTTGKVVGSITFSGIGIPKDTLGSNLAYNPNIINITYDSDPFVNYDFNLLGNETILSKNLVHPGTNIVLNNGSMNPSQLGGHLSILPGLNEKLETQGVKSLVNSNQINTIAKLLGKTPEQVSQDLDGSINQLVNAIGSQKVKELTVGDGSEIRVQIAKGTTYSIIIDNSDNIIVRVSEKCAELYDSIGAFYNEAMQEGKEIVNNLKVSLNKSFTNFQLQIHNGINNFICLFNKVDGTIDSIKTDIGTFVARNLDSMLLEASGKLILNAAFNPVVDSFYKLFLFNNLFGLAEATTRKQDPIILDLDGDGVETTNLQKGTNFDLDCNGFAERTSWVGQDDGVLAIDLNNDGKIDSGRELFGDRTLLANDTLATSGYQALSEYDSNGDNKIDASDEKFAQLKVLKGDGAIFTLTELGIESINLTNTATNTTDSNGNIQVKQGTYTNSDNTTGQVAELNLNRDTTSSVATDSVEVPADVEAMPEMRGMGTVYSLHQAMARDTSGALKALVQAFITETDTNVRYAIVEDILVKWANCENVDPNNMARGFNAQELAVLEKFIGHSFRDVSDSGVNPAAQPIVETAFQELKAYVNAQLMAQTHLKPIFDTIEFAYDPINNKLTGDLSTVISTIQNQINLDPQTGKVLLSQFANTIKKLQLQNSVNYDVLYNAFAQQSGDLKLILDTADKISIYGTSADDTIDASTQDEAIFAGNGNDTIYARQGDDIVFGEGGNDTIDTCLGNDTIGGGLGNDFLDGGDGDDTYIFNFGDGQDTISDTSWLGGENAGVADKIKFGAGITANNLEFTASGYNLVIKLKDNNGNLTGDQLTVKYQLSTNMNGVATDAIETFEFNGGTSLTAQDVVNLIGITNGTPESDTLNGSNISDIMYGYAGDDTINAQGGNDTIVGGTGNDMLYGGDGDDTYVFNFGDGQDTISDSSWLGGNNAGTADKIKFGTGITLDNLDFAVSGYHLVIKLKDNDGNLTGDQLTVKYQFSTNMNGVATDAIETFEFNDGTSLTAQDVVNILATIKGTSGDDTLNGSPNADTIYGYAGNDTINGQFGNDIVVGGTGNDMLYGGDGDDTYIFNFGDGQDTISDSSWLGGNNAGVADKIKFGTGITVDNLDFAVSGYHLVIKLKDDNGTPTGDQLTVRYQFSANLDGIALDAIETLEFSDGTSLRITSLNLGAEGADTINGTNKDDAIISGNGDDICFGQAGNDTIFGGLGNDYLQGDSGNDVYIFNRGDGQDTISDVADGNDTVQFDNGITVNDLKFLQSGNDLIIQNKNNSDQITITNQFSDPLYTIENFRFSNGTVLSNTDIQSLIEVPPPDGAIRGTEAGETITGTSGADTIYAYGGNDTVITAGGDDTVYLGDGDDTVDASAQPSGNYTLYGEAGNDFLQGSSGNDTISGGTGNDTVSGIGGDNRFLFNLGDGHDTIWNCGTETNVNTLKFGEGISVNNLVFTQQGNSLQISFTNSSDLIDIPEQYIGLAGHAIAKFEFNDGSSLTEQEVLDIIQNPVIPSIQGTEAGETITGTSGADTIYGYGGNDTVITAGGDDTVYLGDGDDTVDASAQPSGNYTLYGEAGNDFLQGSSGNDTISGGTGDDTVSGIGGNNRFLFNLGDGHDTIWNAGDENSINTLKFGEGISVNNLVFTQQGNGLQISFTNSTDLIDIPEQYITNVAGHNITKFEFSNGLSLTEQEVLDIIQNPENPPADGTIRGTEVGETITGTSGADTIYAYGGNDTVITAGGDDTVYLGDGDDTVNVNAEDQGQPSGNYTLYGEAGNDFLQGSSGNDTISGGTGDDTVSGIGGDNRFLFSLGDGHDTIWNCGTETNVNTLKFGEGISVNNLVFTRQDNGLQISFTNSADLIDIPEQYIGLAGHAIAKFEFNDGSSLTEQEVLDLIQNPVIPPIQGTEAGETINGTSGADTIYGNGGDDILYSGDGDDVMYGGDSNDQLHGQEGNSISYGGNGNDTIYGHGDDYDDGGAGDDTIIGEYGSDTIIGGTGNDYLQGDSGNDTYLFNLGDGQDTICESSAQGGEPGSDTIKFAADVSKDSISLFMQGNNLVLGYGTNDQITITDQTITNNQIERFELSDAKFITAADINLLVQNMTAYATEHSIQLSSINDVKSNQDLMTMVAASWHS